jgi:hypothetical protein
MTIQNKTIIFFLFGLFACSSSLDKKQLDPISIDDRVLYPKINLSPLFDSLRPATQTFTIDGDRDTLLVGQNGTTLTILKNTFVNSQRQPAKTVSINLVEVNSIADIIKANLQTTSGDRILQTGGMFSIDAKENAKSLTIAEGKVIYVEIKSNRKDPRMKIFDGKFDDNGKIDWTTTGTLENSLIPIPLSLVNFHYCDFECGFSKKQTDDLSNPKFENTYIATREFEERCCAMAYATCPQSLNLSQEFLDIYVANIDKPLFYADSLVADYMVKNFKNKIDTTKKFDFNDTGWFTYMFQSFTELKNQHLTNTINLAKLGINESTTTEDLISKGYSQVEAEKYIAFFKTRKQIVKLRENEKQTSRLASYSFNINKLGWVNVDRFIDDINTEVSTFSVQIKSKDTLDFVSVSLVIPGYNVAVFSIYNDGNVYSFTKKKDGFRTLPVGQNAFVVAFSYKDNKPYFGKEKIRIPKEGQIDLLLTASTEQGIKQDIKKLME